MPEFHHAMSVNLIRYGGLSMVWLQNNAPSELTCFDYHEQLNMSARFEQSALFVQFPCSKKHHWAEIGEAPQSY